MGKKKSVTQSSASMHSNKVAEDFLEIPYHEAAGGSVDLPELLFGGESLGWLVVFCTDSGQLMEYVNQNMMKYQRLDLDYKAALSLKKMACLPMHFEFSA
jgi:hypothetical protein